MTKHTEAIAIEQDVRRDIRERGFAWIPAPAWSIDAELEKYWQSLREDWHHLELDRYLENGATFRRRRYGRYYWSPAQDELMALPNEAYFQPAEENAYAGGIVREFAPLLADTVDNPFLMELVRRTFACLPVAQNKQGHTWEVRVHQIRIIALAEKPGVPTPEGIHQDGTDFLTLHLVRRENIAGGVSTIYDLEKKPIESYTLREPMDSFILEDPRIMHGVTPVDPVDARSEGVRDLLGIDFIYSPTLGRPVSGA